mmetsp:Transcript_8477/g.28852  ORF Transcript_8477/g.28852 Transcript_8477/m.28852 type:complete len:295 (-) Transcript_8477:101-985(-)
MQGPPAEAEHGAHGELVVRVHQDEVLCKEEAHHAGRVPPVHGDAGEARLVALEQGLEGEAGGDLHAEGVVQLGHDGVHALVGKRERGGHEVLLLGAQVADGVLHRDGEQLVQLLAVVRDPQLPPQGAVQELGDGPRDREEERDEEPYHVYGHGADLEAVLGAHGLGHDLPEDEDEGRGDDGPREARGEVRGRDRDEGVDRGVAQEQRAEQEVAALAQGQDAPGEGLLDVVPAGDDELQARDVQRHEPQCEPREEGGHDEEAERDHDVGHHLARGDGGPAGDAGVQARGPEGAVV